MSVEPENADEMALILAWRRTSPRFRESVLAAIRRRLDGQPIEEAMIEALIEAGETPSAARAEVRVAIESLAADYRTALN